MLRYIGSDKFELDLESGERIEISRVDILELLSEIDDKKQNYNSPFWYLAEESREARKAKRDNRKGR